MNPKRRVSAARTRVMEGRRTSALLDITKLLLLNISVKFHIANIFRSGEASASEVFYVVYCGASA
jgi:hypothetical protein